MTFNSHYRKSTKMLHQFTMRIQWTLWWQIICSWIFQQREANHKSIHIGGAIFFSYLAPQKTTLSILPSHFKKHSTSVVLFFLPIHLNIIYLLIFYYFFHTCLSLSHLKILKNNKQTQNPNHLHCHPQPTATSTVHRPPLTQPKSTKFATKSSQKPTKITHTNNQYSTNPQI